MLKPRTILLDAGHGLDLDGTWRRPLMYLTPNGQVVHIKGMKTNRLDNAPGFYREDIGTLIIAKHAQTRLIELGHKVYITRDGERLAKYYIPTEIGGIKWQMRTWSSFTWIKKYAEHLKSEALVSIHTNGGGGEGISGFYVKEPGKNLAMNIATQLSNTTGMKIRKIQKHALAVLRHCPPHGRRCLIECGFHDNPKDLAILVSQDGPRKIGYSIADGIHTYFSHVN